jgi:hypothetical protein
MAHHEAEYWEAVREAAYALTAALNNTNHYRGQPSHLTWLAMMEVNHDLDDTIERHQDWMRERVRKELEAILGEERAPSPWRRELRLVE